MLSAFLHFNRNIKAHWSSGQDVALSRRNRGFDSPMGHLEINSPTQENAENRKVLGIFFKMKLPTYVIMQNICGCDRRNDYDDS